MHNIVGRLEEAAIFCGVRRAHWRVVARTAIAEHK